MWGGTLASITSVVDSQKINDYLEEKGTPNAYWIGLSDRKKEGTWEWEPNDDGVVKKLD